MILQNDDRAVEIVDASALAPNVLFQCIKYVVEMIVRESPDITELRKKKKGQTQYLMLKMTSRESQLEG